MKRRLDKQRSTLNGKWTLIAIFVVLMIGAFLGAINNQSKIADEPKKEIKVADEKKTTAEKQPEIKSTDLKNSAPDTIENDLKLYDENIDKVVVRDKALIVTYKDSAFWSDNSLLEEYAYDSINLIEDIYSNQNFDLFAFERPTVMTDDNGNEKLDTVFKSFYTRNTLDQMNLDNFTDMVLVDRKRYFQKADGYWLHPGIFLNVDKKLREGIRSPINFDNMDESRYNMRDGATNDVVEQPDSVKKEKPIVAEPVTEDAVEEPQTEAEQSISYDAPAIVNSTFIITQGFDQLSFKIEELSVMVGTKGDLITAPLSSSLFSLKEMMDHTGQEITKLQQTSTPSDIGATTEQLATNQAEMNQIYEELQQQFYSIDKQDYPDAAQLVSAIKQNFSMMEKLTHPDVSAYSKYFKENADEQGN